MRDPVVWQVSRRASHIFDLLNTALTPSNLMLHQQKIIELQANFADRCCHDKIRRVRFCLVERVSAMCEAYRQLVSNPSAIFQQINPHGTNNAAICPETADALGDFLTSTIVRSIRTRSNSANFNFLSQTRTSWSDVRYDDIGRSLRGCSHEIIESTRHDNAHYPNHYFVVFKVDNKIYIADAFTHDLEEGMDNYARAGNLNPADLRDPGKWTFKRIPGALYDVAVSDPLSDLDRPSTDPLEGIN